MNRIQILVIAGLLMLSVSYLHIKELGRTQHLSSPDQVPEGLSVPDWSSIRQQYEQHRHALLPIPNRDGHQARNPGQQWQTRFDGRGFTIQPDAKREERGVYAAPTSDGEETVKRSEESEDRAPSPDAGVWQWGLEIRSYGFPGHERAVTGKACVSAAGQRVGYEWDDTLQEWFINDARGLEHGFTVHQRPATKPEPEHPATNIQQPTSNELAAVALGVECSMFDVRCFPNPHPLTFTLAVRGNLRPEVQADGRGVRFVDAEGAAAITYAGLTVFDAHGRTLPARFEVMAGKPIAERGVHAASTPDSEGTVKRPEDRHPETVAAILRLAIDERGARYPLTIDPIAQQAYLKASNTEANDEFGGAVAVSGDTVVVGALGESSNATGVNGNQGNNNRTNSGAAYVFVRSGTNWSLQAYLKASNAGAEDWFGYSVAISGNTVVVGAPLEASNATGVNGNQSNNSALTAGAAYVFVRNGTNWSQQAYLKASNTGAGDEFGGSVSVSGDTVVVGALGESSNATGVNGNQSNNAATNSGAAYVFVRSGTTWTQQAYLKASNTGTNDWFGQSVSVSGDTVLVGANQEDSNASRVNGDGSDNSAFNSGAAYVFVRSGTTWTQQAYLKASNTEVNDQFGYAVAVSGDTVVVGAYAEDSNATGVNGDQSDNSATQSGAAYVFVRSGTTWTQQAYLKASNTDGGDVFGWSVAVSGDTVVVGAFFEDSNATGVNGNETDNSAVVSGAAYVFVRSGTAWTQQAYLKASNTGSPDGFGYAVAASGDTVVVGAYGEASNATGVNGDGTNNSAPYCGAAYIFSGLGIGPRLAIVPDGSSGYFIRFNGIPGFTCRLQRAPSVSGPWDTIATSTAPASGLIEYHDAPAPLGQAFYRTVQP